MITQSSSKKAQPLSGMVSYFVWERELERIVCEQVTAEWMDVSMVGCFSWNLPLITKNPTQVSLNSTKQLLTHNQEI